MKTRRIDTVMRLDTLREVPRVLHAPSSTTRATVRVIDLPQSATVLRQNRRHRGFVPVSRRPSCGR